MDNFNVHHIPLNLFSDAPEALQSAIKAFNGSINSFKKATVDRKEQWENILNTLRATLFAYISKQQEEKSPIFKSTGPGKMSVLNLLKKARTLDAFQQKLTENKKFALRKKDYDYMISIIEQALEKYRADEENMESIADIARARKKIGDVKKIMDKNVDSILKRGDDLKWISEKADELHKTAQDFSLAATGLKKTESSKVGWWILLAFGIATAVLLAIAATAFILLNPWAGLLLPALAAGALSATAVSVITWAGVATAGLFAAGALASATVAIGGLIKGLVDGAAAIKTKPKYTSPPKTKTKDLRIDFKPENGCTLSGTTQKIVYKYHPLNFFRIGRPTQKIVIEETKYNKAPAASINQ